MSSNDTCSDVAVESGVVDAPTVEPPSQRWLLWTGVAGLLLVVLAAPIRDVIDSVLPGRATIPSRGVGFPAFGDVGDTIIRRTGIAVLFATATALVLSRTPISIRRWLERVGPGLVIVATGLWYAWLGTPHNAFPSNARFHWVDYLTFDDDNFFYAAGRIPHMVFYDHPFVWNGLVAASVAGLLYLIGRQLALSRLLSTSMAMLPAISGNLLLFSSTAEDLMFNVALCLVAVHAALVRRPIYLGLALAVTILGRPSFVILIPCLVAAELIATIREDRSFRRIDWRYLAVVIGAAAALTAVMQILFTVLGDRYLLVNGEIIDKGPLDDAVAIEVEGFTISAFSGAYVGHFLWMMPAVFLVGAVAAAAASRHLMPRVERVVLFCALAVVGLLFVHESQPLNSYAQRYLTYTLPFLVVMSWSWLSPRRSGGSDRWMFRPPARDVRRFVAALLVAGSLVIPASPFDERSARAERDEIELLEIKDSLRELSEGREVFYGGGSKTSRNYMAYVLKTRRGRFQPIAEWPNPEVEDGALVVIRRSAAPGVEPLVETDSWVAFIANTEER